MTSQSSVKRPDLRNLQMFCVSVASGSFLRKNSHIWTALETLSLAKTTGWGFDHLGSLVKLRSVRVYVAASASRSPFKFFVLIKSASRLCKTSKRIRDV